MQLEAAEPGRRPAHQQFPGVDLRRPKGYAAPPAAEAVASQKAADTTAAGEGEPCPRCESRDTKFCYFNNYNTAQPRHFCKGCCRYWTKGGTLRNVPVGGGTRKKASSSSSSSASSSPSSTSSAAAKPKRPYKKKRRVAPPEPVASPAEPAKTTTAKTEATTPTADAASEVTTELVAPAAAAEEDSLTDLLQQPEDATAVALGLGLSDFPTGKGGLLDLEPSSFEWPAAFDLGACWASAGFADPDPALFLNFP